MREHDSFRLIARPEDALVAAFFVLMLGLLFL